MRCRGVQGIPNPAFLGGFLCCVLHRIALPVVSEWCQEAVDYASLVPTHYELSVLRSTAALRRRRGVSEGEPLQPQPTPTSARYRKEVLPGQRKVRFFPGAGVDVPQVLHADLLFGEHAIALRDEAFDRRFRD